MCRRSVESSGAILAMQTRRLSYVIGVGLAVIVVGVFCRTLTADFLHWDDDINVVENSNIQGLALANIKWMFVNFEQAIRYKPLAWLTWALIHSLFGLNPVGFHLANVLLHAGNTVLVFVVIAQIAGRVPGRERDLNRARERLLLAGGCALLWALHPLRVEPVAWVTGLPYHLSLAFLLVSMIGYLRLDFTRSVYHQRAYWASVGCFLAALLAYPISVGFCAVLVAVNLYPLKRLNLSLCPQLFSRLNRSVWVELIPFISIAAVIAGITLYGRYTTPGIWKPVADTTDFPMMARAMQSFYVWALYTWKPFLPIHLSPVYLDLVDFRPNDFRFLISAAGVLGLTGYLWHQRRVWPGAFAIWVAHLGILIPVLGLTEHPHFPSDRYAIIDGVILSVGCFALLWTGRQYVTFKRMRLGVIGVIILLAVMSFRQTQFWKNDYVFFSYVAGGLKDGLMRAKVFTRLGDTYLRDEDWRSATQFYSRAWQSAPNYGGYQLPANYALALEALGDFPGAEAQLNLAGMRRPDDADLLQRLGMMTSLNGKPDESILCFRRAVEIDPANPERRFYLGLGLIKIEQYAEAEKILQQCVTLSPDFAGNHQLLELVYQRLNQPERAKHHGDRFRQLSNKSSQ